MKGTHCAICNAYGDLIQHRRTMVRYGNERPEDLTTLCRKCHKVIIKHIRLAEELGTQEQREQASIVYDAHVTGIVIKRTEWSVWIANVSCPHGNTLHGMSLRGSGYEDCKVGDKIKLIVRDIRDAGQLPFIEEPVEPPPLVLMPKPASLTNPESKPKNDFDINW